jgi:hypothetical protein
MGENVEQSLNLESGDTRSVKYNMEAGAEEN